MPLHLLLVIMGGAFLILGIAFYFWGRFEEERYFNTIVHRFDVREYLEHLPFRPEPGALRIGGIVSMSLGILLLAAGLILFLLKITIMQ
jgi:hypothetical protein